MSDVFQAIDGARRMHVAPTPGGVLLVLLLAFLLGQVLAWTYARTHSGLSYSRTFTQSLVFMSVVVALLMAVIGDSLVTAFGLLGALALVRFRNVLKDTRDTVYLLMAIAVGIAVGTERFVLGIVGMAGLVAMAWYMDFVAFGTLSRFDGYLTVRLAAREVTSAQCEAVLYRFCRTARQVSRRQSGAEEEAEVVYQIGLRDRSRERELLEALQRVVGVTESSVLLRDEVPEA